MATKRRQSLVRTSRSLPNAPGVYIFRDARGVVLYVGKASSLKSRVRSYFTQPHETRIMQMVTQIKRIEVKPTRSALEALFLEAELIKKYQAKYNIMAKDDKTFAYIAFTKEPVPRIIIVRPTDRTKEKIAKLFGPYQSAALARTALKILRRIFPFHSLKTRPGEKCFHVALGQCPGVCSNRVTPVVTRLLHNPQSPIRNQKIREYRRTLRNVEMFLWGKRTRLEAGLKRQMAQTSRAQRYEEAARLRDSIEALKHINDVALLKDEFVALSIHRPSHLSVPHRIEAYDISHTFGRSAVGSMVVFTNGRIDANAYRKFKIRGRSASEAKLPSATGSGSFASSRHDRWIDDTGMLKEVLTRRLKHREWPYPDLILMDGGAAQLSVAHRILRKFRVNIPAAALAKGPERKRADLYTADSSVKLIPLQLLIKLRDEAHRFAIRYHRTLRERTLIG